METAIFTFVLKHKRFKKGSVLFLSFQRPLSISEWFQLMFPTGSLNIYTSAACAHSAQYTMSTPINILLHRMPINVHRLVGYQCSSMIPITITTTTTTAPPLPPFQSNPIQYSNIHDRSCHRKEDVMSGRPIGRMAYPIAVHVEHHHLPHDSNAR